jgi:hypothetical protein
MLRPYWNLFAKHIAEQCQLLNDTKHIEQEYNVRASVIEIRKNVETYRIR